MTNSLIFLAIGILGLVGAIYTFKLWRGIKAANDFVVTQHCIVSEEFIESYMSGMTERGLAGPALVELKKIRELYGPDQVRSGHLMWIYAKLQGDIQDGEIPPSFNPELKGPRPD